MKKLFCFIMLFISTLYIVGCGTDNNSSPVNGEGIKNNSQIPQSGNVEQSSQTSKIPEKVRNVKKSVEKNKDISLCEEKIKDKNNILTCKQLYIMDNKEKLEESVCDNIKEKEEQKLCREFMSGEDGTAKQQTGDSASSVGNNQLSPSQSKEVNKVVEKAESNMDINICGEELEEQNSIQRCKQLYIMDNKEELEKSVCNKLVDEKEQEACKEFISN